MLQSLYGRVIIPEAVYQEVTGGVPGLPGAWATQELHWIVSQPVQNDAMVRALQGELDHGEAEAITLAVELQAGLILIDERRARAIAARMGHQCRRSAWCAGRSEAQSIGATSQTDLGLLNRPGRLLGESIVV